MPEIGGAMAVNGFWLALLAGPALRDTNSRSMCSRNGRVFLPHSAGSRKGRRISAGVIRHLWSLVPVDDVATTPRRTDAYYSAANYGSWNVLSKFFSMDRKIAIVFLNTLSLLRSPFHSDRTSVDWMDYKCTLEHRGSGMRPEVAQTVDRARQRSSPSTSQSLLAWAWPLEQLCRDRVSCSSCSLAGGYGRQPKFRRCG